MKGRKVAGITKREAAVIAGVIPRRIQALIANKQIKAKKLQQRTGWLWLVDEQSLRDWMRNKPAGRPPKR